MINKRTVIGIDLGASNIRGAVLDGEHLSQIISERIDRDGSMDEVLQHFYHFADRLMNDKVKAIGIGVPGIADNGMVYDVINIPSWKEIPLRSLLEDRYKVPVFIENDANCFALGEFQFGKGIGNRSMIGLTIGTGLGCGIIIDGKLYAGDTGAAGEFGMASYLDRNYDYYASGQFFENVHGISGEMVYRNATQADVVALNMYNELGLHIGNAIQTIMYSTDISLIVLGGSVRKAYPYFSKTMWDFLREFGFGRSVERLKIEISDLENGAVLGAAVLTF